MAFEQEHEREPSTEELAELTDIPESEISHILQSNIHHASLDHPVGDDEGTTSGDLLPSDSLTDPDLSHESFKYEVKKFMRYLNENQCKVIYATYGLDGTDKLTIEQIANRMNLTQSRVEQIKQKAMRHLLAKAKKQRVRY